jgi:predicted nucleic acid-binding protein
VIHLDTNYLIGMSKPTTPAGRQVTAWVAAGETLGCSAMAWAEYLCGPVTAADQADVAAVALRSGAAVATENRADFAPFVAAGVRVVP